MQGFLFNTNEAQKFIDRVEEYQERIGGRETYLILGDGKMGRAGSLYVQWTDSHGAICTVPLFEEEKGGV
jgi:hypothetical protein